jgi:hypothetical protein
MWKQLDFRVMTGIFWWIILTGTTSAVEEVVAREQENEDCSQDHQGHA